MRDRLDKYVDINSEICVNMSTMGSAVYDFCCFGIDKEGKLSDDRYMIFYNQLVSPADEVFCNLTHRTISINTYREYQLINAHWQLC